MKPSEECTTCIDVSSSNSDVGLKDDLELLEEVSWKVVWKFLEFC